ncbi:MAG TPA: RNA polymerase sigma factor [Ktedonobacterales bacterium]|nr:RNA polymerase sigma factor [Ktedonobacterales bacterium]
MERTSDERLLDAVVAGETSALTMLVERYQQELTGYLNRLVGADWALAQDLAQETFLRVLRQPTTRGERPFRPWLYTIATNLARDHFKAGAVRFSAPLGIEQESVLVDEAPSPEDYALQGEERDAMVAALNLLGVDYRAALWLRFYGGLSLAEIAAALDTPVGTVKWRISTGLRRLRCVLAASEQGVAQQEEDHASGQPR